MDDFSNNESYYDIIEDYKYIEPSFAEQYHIRLRETTMKWSEYSRLVSSLKPETTLGRIIAIRSEKDPKILKNFNREQKRIRYEWLEKEAQNIDKKTYDEAMAGFSKMFKSLGKEKK